MSRAIVAHDIRLVMSSRTPVSERIERWLVGASEAATPSDEDEIDDVLFGPPNGPD